MRADHELRFGILAAAMACALLVSGCSAGSAPLALDEMARMRDEGKFVVVVRQPPPAFRQRGRFDENWSVSFGPLAVAVTESNARAMGEATRTRFRLEDPAFLVSERFGGNLVRELGIRAPEEPHVTDMDEVEELARRPGWPGVVLEFETLGWGIGSARMPFGSDLDYVVFYMGSVRVLRVREQKILWQNFCHVSAPETGKVTVAMFLENDATLLKAMLVEAAESCAEVLFSQMAGRTGSKGARR